MTETIEGAPAADPPGDTIYICPACGARYDDPGECTNGHGATETVPYVKAEVEAFDQAAQAAAAAGETSATSWPEPAEGAAVPDNAGADPHALAQAGLLTIPEPVPAEQVPTPPAAAATVTEAVPAVEAAAPAGSDGQAFEPADLSQPVEPPAAEVGQPAEPAAPAGIDAGLVAQAFADLEANLTSMLATVKAHLGL